MSAALLFIFSLITKFNAYIILFTHLFEGFANSAATHTSVIIRFSIAEVKDLNRNFVFFHPFDKLFGPINYEDVRTSIKVLGKLTVNKLFFLNRKNVYF